MKFSTQSLALALAAASCSPALASEESPSAGLNSGLPPNHPPMHPTLAKFSSQFRCPYAKEWLAKGAHKAAIDLGLTNPKSVDASLLKQPQPPHRSRVLQASGASAKGSCSFTNPWSGPTCMEFRGEGWTEDNMAERCSSEADSALSPGEGCQTPTELAGFCVSESAAAAGSEEATMIEATSMMISGASDCGGNKMACETFVGGSWEAADSCGGSGPAAGAPTMGGSMMGGGGFDYANMAPSGSSGDGTCLLAPGAIGAAHQAGFSNGYSAACPGTPAEGSPYMWPMAWATDFDTQSMAFGSDDVVWRSQGRTFYRLDKNWKRSDTTFSNGILRTIGQGPCDDIDEEESKNGVVGCNKNTDFSKGDPLTTMIHRGSKMYFITWKNSTEVKIGETDPSLIEECNHMNLMVVGNIRPDWFLDNRGDDTDVQYLGDQHVYYADGNIPRLVKQWRKKDFASQYFTMSVTGNPKSNPKRNRKLMVQNATTSDDDAIHWPLILNVPGEGFGDDMLQVYTNHEMLSDEDDDLFMLIENLEASGGSCPLIQSANGDDGEPSTVGPPQLEVHVPSNLEVDPNSWFSNVYTFSPVWQPPMKANLPVDVPAGETGVALTEEGRVRVESCYDPSSQSVKLSVEWLDVTPIPTEKGAQLPWVSLGYRPTEVCAMNPIDGSDSKIVMVTQGPNETAPKAYAGSLAAGAKRLDQDALGSIYDSFWPLDETLGYSNVQLSLPSEAIKIERQSMDASQDTVKLSFHQSFESKPDAMHLMYAIGMSPQLGVHISRGCLEVVEFPTCAASDGSSATKSSGQAGSPSMATQQDSSESISSSSTVSASALAGVAAVLPALIMV